MKHASAVSLGLLLAVAAMGSDRVAVGGDCVSARLENTASIPNDTLLAARLTAARLFEQIDIALQTKLIGEPRAGCLAVTLVFSRNAKPTFHPGALAYAHPFANGGTQVEIFTDRILHGPGYNDGTVLGHVIAHEIGHVLQGVDRHSDEGLMKAAWDGADHARMGGHKLGFAPHDAQLIHEGLTMRRLRAASCGASGCSGNER